MFMAHNHIQLIVEVALIIHVGVMLFFNTFPVSLSMVLFLALILTVGFAALFGIDSACLFLPYMSHHEFTHPFGPIALFSWITVMASANLLSEVEIRSTSIKAFAIILFVIIAVAGGLMHRSFLLLWFLGWIIGIFVMSKSFKRSSSLTFRRLMGLLAAGGLGFGILEVLSRIFNASVLSPLARIAKLGEYAVPSLKMVIGNTLLWGHVQGSCFWKSGCLGGSCGYIHLPMSLYIQFGLPYPLFYGILVNKKDMIDYMLPGIFGVAFDFGYVGILSLLIWNLIVICAGFFVLRKYREKRKLGSRMYLGREALLIGALSAFIAQSIVGLFIFNRSINGFAMITYMLLSALVISHVVTVRRSV